MEEVTLKMMLEKDLEQQKAFQTLLKAISNRDYAAAEEMLKQLGKTSVVRNRSFDLCSCAIRSGCPRDVFVRLLPYCRPLDELEKCAVSRSSGLLPYIGEEGGLVQEAAKWNHAAVLEYLLEQGLSPNARRERSVSPLELALMHHAQDVLQLLAGRDDVDFTVTERILNCWGAMGMNPETDACLRIVAGRLAVHVLRAASPALLAKLLETETLFPQEDASALLRYCETMMDFRRQEKRNILLAYLRKDIRYEI